MRTPVRDESMADQLAAASKELDALTYAISHDLRTPLRAIDGFSRALLAEHAGQLDDEGRRYLERIRAGTQRMAQLIDDLLGLTRITRGPVNRERVDLSAIARQVLSNLAARHPERIVESVVTEGLVAHADARLSTMLLHNLLENAWKFSGKAARARIEVTRETPPDGDGPAFVVRDNGAGFDMNYGKKLFQPFQRLHAAADFPGTGIGLAAAERAVTRHGGRIWARSAPDQGATFYFTLGEPA
jgi:light-regulated signal transduction histidine kinase (bacteriophytochrome)